jgi:hypothetical protein
MLESFLLFGNSFGEVIMRKDKKDSVRKKLIEVAKRGETITYGELMKEVKIPRGGRKPEIGIGGVVGQISEDEHCEGRPRLSAIAVRTHSRRKNCPQGHPGGGFFGLEGIPPEFIRPRDHSNLILTSREKQFVKQEQEKVWNYWKMHND